MSFSNLITINASSVLINETLSSNRCKNYKKKLPQHAFIIFAKKKSLTNPFPLPERKLNCNGCTEWKARIYGGILMYIYLFTTS